MKKNLWMAFCLLAVLPFAVNAQTETESAKKKNEKTRTVVDAPVNLQGFYDFGRKHVTTTIEMFKADNWGSTYFFTDIDYNYRNDRDFAVAPSGAYLEFSRCLNFWQNTKMGGLNIHLEWDAGLGITKYFNPMGVAQTGGFPINNAFLAGANYCWHSENYDNVLNFQLLYKHIFDVEQLLPMQATFVWTCKNLGNVKGLTFSGFVDCWWQDNVWGVNPDLTLNTTNIVLLSEPQLWYCVGQWFNCGNLNVGGEVELSCNFYQKGFRCNPCLGLKWVF